MCFSPTADFVAAAVLAPVGVLAAREIRRPQELLIGLLPLGFALHQFTEGFVWLGTEGKVSGGVEHVAVVLYLLFAQVLLPLLVPLGIILMEPSAERRRWMYPLMGIGVAVAVRFAWILATHPVGAVPLSHTMAYRSDTQIGPWVTAGYILATIGPTLLSSRPYLRAFGVAILIGLVWASVIRYEAVTSVWCVFAALVSVLILLHFRREHRTAGAPEPAAA